MNFQQSCCWEWGSVFTTGLSAWPVEALTNVVWILDRSNLEYLPLYCLCEQWNHTGPVLVDQLLLWLSRPLRTPTHHRFLSAPHTRPPGPFHQVAFRPANPFWVGPLLHFGQYVFLVFVTPQHCWLLHSDWWIMFEGCVLFVVTGHLCLSNQFTTNRSDWTSDQKFPWWRNTNIHKALLT